MSNHKEKKFQTPFEVPNQKYLLERRDQDGHYVKVETFDAPITTEYALGKHGPGVYFLKPCKPTFWKVLWHEKLGTEQEGNLQESTTSQVRSLEKKTNNLVIGVAGLGVGTVVGWGLTAWTLAGHGQRLNRIEGVVEAQLKTNSTPIFQCSRCGQPLDDPLGNFCGRCGGKIFWPDDYKKAQPSERQCVYCQSPAKPEQFFCTECGMPLFVLVPEAEAPKWRLP